MPEFIVPVHEHNPCHEPAGSAAGGQFAVKGSCADTVTRVGITSFKTRDKADPAYRSPHAVLGRDMREFKQALQAIPTVTNVSVKSGTGAYQGGWEPTWIVGYRGNGEARKLIARTAKKWDQEAVLMMHAGKRDPAVEFQFEGNLPHNVRSAVSEVMGAEGLGGWTWGMRGKNLVVRAVSVPTWGGDASDHLAKMQRVAAALQARGMKFKQRIKHVETEVLSRDDGDYDRILNGE